MAGILDKPIWSADGLTLSNVLLPVTNLYATYNVITEWYDGTPMDDSKLDTDLVYVKFEDKYLLRNMEYGQVLQKDTMAQMRALSTEETLLLRLGVYKHVQLNGYYEDEPKYTSAIAYNLSNTTVEDDGGSAIEVNGCYLTIDNKVVGLENFGAKGNASEIDFSGDDDTQPIINAITYVNKINGVLLSAKGKSYLFKDRDFVLQVSKNAFKCSFNASKILMKNSTMIFERNSNANFKTISFSGSLKKGDTFITVSSLSDLTGVNIGDLVEITSNAIVYENITLAQYYVVNDIDRENLRIYTECPIVGDVNLEQISDDGATGNINIGFKDLYEGLELENMEFVSSKEKDSTVTIRNHNNLTVRNVNVKNPSRFGIYIQYGGNDNIYNCSFYRHGYVKYDQGYQSVPSSPDGLSFGYGLIHARNASSIVEQCKGFYGWHTFDAAVGQTYIKYVDCDTFKDAYGFSTHGGSWDVSYINCNTVGGCGVTVRCVSVTVQGGNLASNLYGHSIAGFGSLNTVLKGTIINKTSNYAGSPIFSATAPIFGSGAMSANESPTVIIDDLFIENQNSQMPLTCQNIIINNLTIKTRANEGASLFLDGSNIVVRKLNIIGVVKGQFPITVRLKKNLNCYIEGLFLNGTYEQYANSAAVGFSGVIAPEEIDTLNITLRNCDAKANYLFRALTSSSNLKISEVIDCKYNVLGAGDSTVLVYNCYNNVGFYPELLQTGAKFYAFGVRNNNVSTNARKIGTTAQRPGPLYCGLNNNYHNTDTGITEVWNGSAWVSPMAPMGLITDSTATDILELNNKFNALLVELKNKRLMSNI